MYTLRLYLIIFRLCSYKMQPYDLLDGKSYCDIVLLDKYNEFVSCCSAVMSSVGSAWVIGPTTADHTISAISLMHRL